MSLLLKLSGKIEHLSLFDIVNTPGVAADISHCDSKAKASKQPRRECSFRTEVPGIVVSRTSAVQHMLGRVHKCRASRGSVGQRRLRLARSSLSVDHFCLAWSCTCARRSPSILNRNCLELAISYLWYRVSFYFFPDFSTNPPAVAARTTSVPRCFEKIDKLLDCRKRTLPAHSGRNESRHAAEVSRRAAMRTY